MEKIPIGWIYQFQNGGSLNIYLIIKAFKLLKFSD